MHQTLSPETVGFNDVAQYVLGDIALAVAACEPLEAARTARANGAMAAAMGLFPSDVGPMMVAGQAVMFHALTVRAARRMLTANTAESVAAERSVISLGRAFTTNLNALARMRGRASKGWLTPPPKEDASSVESSTPSVPNPDETPNPTEAPRQPMPSAAAEAPKPASVQPPPDPLSEERVRRLEALLAGPDGGVIVHKPVQKPRNATRNALLSMGLTAASAFAPKGPPNAT